jgi:phosphohistidine phosphatase
VRAVHSGKLRARQTVEGLAPLLASDKYIETRQDMNPNDSTASLREQIASWTDDTLLVGHLPFMDRFLAHLLTGSETNSVAAYRPGTLVCLERGEDNPGEDNLWKIAWMVRPELLGEP